MIKILVKRKVPPHKEEALKSLIDQLRSITNGQPGYVSGETLKRVDRPGESLVVSKWQSLGLWNQWFASQERAAAQAKIDALLGEPTEYEIYEYD
ncbi:MAG: antibiotic biosynthesis monooxygenase [Desulfobacterales bacterium]|nr:MAG: antibiotic biosynthesis monooxygenase [Desulfobacterales bacterium]